VPRESLRNLHQLAHATIFEQTTWPADPARCDAIERMMLNSGLLKKSAGEATLMYADPRLTGDLELLLACIGMLEPDYILFFLVECGFASKEEALEVREAKTQPEYYQLLRSLTLQAYKKRFVRSISTH